MEKSQRKYLEELSQLEKTSNLRIIPSKAKTGLTDFTSNDYLGLATDHNIRGEFLEIIQNCKLYAMSSSASRLLASEQSCYKDLEKTIENSYNSILNDQTVGSQRLKVLLFNSGYHANTGIIPALVGRGDLILADRLVHASIIDGCRLSGARFSRFPHNDYESLERFLEKEHRENGGKGVVLIIVESIYSMDGDTADLGRIAAIKDKYKNALLYIDEAHSIGVRGPMGLGESVRQEVMDSIDIIVGTFGKALASVWAFALTSDILNRYLLNKARSFIFSTALPPMMMQWSRYIWEKALKADDLREKLANNSSLLAEIIPGDLPSHIRPLITGDSCKAIALSKKLEEAGFNVLPIRTPTVPPGTERLRFSLSASIPVEEIQRLKLYL